MNYEDELERSRARRSRKHESSLHTRDSHGTAEDRWSAHAEPGSRASRNRNASQGGRRRRKRPNKAKRILIGVCLALVVLIVAAAGGGYAYLNHHVKMAQSNNEVDKSEVENLDLSQEVKDKMETGYWTIAVFGVDSRDSSTGSGNQSDVIMIVNIDRKTGEIKLVSVYRDTYLNINDRNTYNKINAAYAQGGPTQALKALNKNLDLNITNYVTFNWKAVATGINILGGVDIDISKSEFYYINAFITETVKGTGIGSVQLKSAGLQHLDGVQAVAYGRLRLMDSDYARTERQRLVIEKAFEKAKKADLATLNSLVGNMAAMCATNIDTNEVLAMAANVTKYHMGETMGFPAARGEKRIKIGSDNLSCVIPQTLESNVISLHNFLFGEEDYSPSNMVLTISEKIAGVTGLSEAGTEIGHVATDQGYIPKATTAAATTAAETEESSTEETSEGESGSDGGTLENGETIETSEGETLENGETSESGLHPGVSESSGEGIGNQTGPSGPSHVTPGTPGSETQEHVVRPSSPADMTQATESYGPGFEDVPEATKSPGPSGSTETPTTGNEPSVIVVSPTTGAVTPSSPADGGTPDSPASGPASEGSTTGPGL